MNPATGLVTVLAAAYGFAGGLIVRRWVGRGGHRRYDDERARPLPSYRLLPALVGLAAAVLAWRLAGAGLPLAAADAALVPAYGALWAVDRDVHRLPDVLTLPLYPGTAALLGAVALATSQGEAWRRSLLAGATVLAVFVVLRVVSRGQLGLGDVKLAGPLGALLGWFSWELVAAGVYAMFLVGGAVAVLLIVRRRAGRQTRLAFGPAMIAGAWLTLLVAA